VSPGLYSSGVVASVVGDGLTGSLPVIGSDVREKRDERGWCGLHPLLSVDIWLVDCTGVLSAGRSGTGTLYLPPDVILL
jgi:hypothetical protein